MTRSASADHLASGRTLRCADLRLELAAPVVMGVVNVTPDSFSDAGRHASTEAAIEHGRRLVAEGAAIVDVGGESTRPGASVVPVAEELRRVLPVIRALAADGGAIVSVDTSRAEVIEAAVAAGARFVNDVRALRAPGALAAAARAGVAVSVMHMQGEPATMQDNPAYGDVVTEVRDFLAGRVAACLEAGIPADAIVVDPGFGFGKTVAHNLELLRELAQFTTLGAPLLVGLSRKSLAGVLTGRPVGERLAGSVALAALAASRGAAIVRAHDVAPTLDAIRIGGALRRARPGD